MITRTISDNDGESMFRDTAWIILDMFLLMLRSKEPATRGCFVKTGAFTFTKNKENGIPFSLTKKGVCTKMSDCNTVFC